MSNPFTKLYDWLLLQCIRVLLAAELGSSLSNEERTKADLAERARADFIVHGGDVEFIERIEQSLGVDWGDGTA